MSPLPELSQVAQSPQTTSTDPRAGLLLSFLLPRRPKIASTTAPILTLVAAKSTAVRIGSRPSMEPKVDLRLAAEGAAGGAAEGAVEGAVVLT